MRKLFVLFALVCASALLASPYEVRSAKHVMTIDVEGEGEAREFVVRVTDNESGALLLSERIAANAQAPEKIVEVDGRRVRVRVAERGGSLAALLVVLQDSMTIDSINTSWLTKPQPATHVPPSISSAGVRGARVLPDAEPLPEGVFRVGEDVKAPVVISRVEPLYPEVARKARIAGIVILETIIDTNGNVREARVLKPLPFGLDQAALDAVRQWKFRPGTRHGEPVDVLFNLTINFRLPDEEAP
jgi:TonB family protein